MLRHFAAEKIRHLGVEPSANVARAAMGKGVNTVCKFFDKALALEIRDEHGRADVILAANVMCHIPIKPYDAFIEHYPEYAFLFAWNHWQEIMEKEQQFRDQGGSLLYMYLQSKFWINGIRRP